MDNTGYLGGVSPDLQAAIQRRQGQGAPTPPPSTPTPQPFNPVAGQPAPMPQANPEMGMPQTPESQIIIKALDGRLKSISKQEEMGVQGGQGAVNSMGQ